jgi:SpoVK/Ycf46/Vps4 family AAA+-type ATPase
LLRKGRFDDLFFVDLPTTTERAAILRAALKQYGRDADGITLATVAEATQDFVGAEIAALVPEAMYAAFAYGARPINDADLLAAAAVTVPLARTAAEKIDKLRQWAKGRARPASAATAAAAPSKARTLDI